MEEAPSDVRHSNDMSSPEQCGGDASLEYDHGWKQDVEVWNDIRQSQHSIRVHECYLHEYLVQLRCEQGEVQMNQCADCIQYRELDSNRSAVLIHAVSLARSSARHSSTNPDQINPLPKIIEDALIAEHGLDPRVM